MDKMYKVLQQLDKLDRMRYCNKKDLVKLIKKVVCISYIAKKLGFIKDEEGVYIYPISELKYQVKNYKQVNGNYTILVDDYTVDNFTPNVTTTMLSAVGIEGQIFNVSNSSGGDITLELNGSETMYLPGGSITSFILTDGQTLTLQSTGSNWRSL